MGASCHLCGPEASERRPQPRRGQLGTRPPRLVRWTELRLGRRAKPPVSRDRGCSCVAERR